MIRHSHLKGIAVPLSLTTSSSSSAVGARDGDAILGGLNHVGVLDIDLLHCYILPPKHDQACASFLCISMFATVSSFASIELESLFFLGGGG